MKRRTFPSHSTLAAAGFTILPSGMMAGTRSPNVKLNIGVGGRGAANLDEVNGENIAALHVCKTGAPTICNFDYSGALVEHNLLCAVAFRAGGKLEWDAAKLEATNCPEAAQLVTKTYRDGWVPNG